jgi:hypothetical protein
MISLMKKIILILILSSIYLSSTCSNPYEEYSSIGFLNIDEKTNQFSPVAKNMRNAHIVSFEYGRVISLFDYKNSEGEKLTNLQGSINNHLNIGWKMHFKTSKLYILSGLSYNKYAAKGSDQALGNYYDWDVNYIGIRAGIGYEFFKTKSFFNFPYVSGNPGITLCVQASIASDFLVKGTQTINNQVFGLVGVEQFDTPFLFAYGGIGLNYYPTKEISIYLQYNGGKGFSVFSDSNDQEKLNYITHIISLGIAISLPL